ncbi:uncharacterized protein B0J16DRAFT_340953 [Fusarium flagelliforme]|uniref:uncharacterized protein n=1 Tax=Fusarium flagelliforme TaxID=2675880 RepID=UPI001E8DA612|nr:uncharacterized protein B0J16DRAFT_340953 [Fusarium flagelliforme]KAH7185151.1 hypothetical protein B0J16DRAFT_340953 [Fusarium flagelliforme]
MTETRLVLFPQLLVVSLLLWVASQTRSSSLFLAMMDIRSYDCGEFAYDMTQGYYTGVDRQVNPLSRFADCRQMRLCNNLTCEGLRRCVVITTRCLPGTQSQS